MFIAFLAAGTQKWALLAIALHKNLCEHFKSQVHGERPGFNRSGLQLIAFVLPQLIGENNECQPKLGVDSLLCLQARGGRSPQGHANQDIPRWGISSVDTWRICADSRNQDQSVKQLVPSLSRNRYEEAEGGLGAGRSGTPALPWAVDAPRDTHGRWWAGARLKVKNLLGPVRHRSEAAQLLVDQPALNEGRKGFTVSPNGSGTSSGLDGSGRVNASRRDELCPVALTGG